MDQLIPSLGALIDGFRGCFRHEVFATFQHLLVGWIIAPGPRTISEVWQATGRAGKDHGDRAYALFASASWDWDDLSKILIVLIVARLIPTGTIWIVVDDTLCHKRGAKVAFGGFFLDAVTSTRKKKNFRFGVSDLVRAPIRASGPDEGPTPEAGGPIADPKRDDREPERLPGHRGRGGVRGDDPQVTGPGDPGRVVVLGVEDREPMTVVLVRDVAGVWRDEVLVATSPSASAEFVIGGYCRRWSIEVRL